MQLSPDRYCVFSGLNDLGGWDMGPALVYQVREGSPVGDVLGEGIAMEKDSDWRPFGIPLARCPQFTVAFGLQKGVKRPDGSAYPNENVFVLQTFINPQLCIDGEPMIPHAARRYKNWPADIDPRDLTDNLPRVFWRHFRLDDSGNDIEFMDEWEIIHQDGFADGYGGGFCSLGESCVTMHGAFSPPLPADEKGDTWYSLLSFAKRDPEEPSRKNPRSMAPVVYTWDRSAGRYRWTATGPETCHEGWQLTDPGLVRMEDCWIVIARGHQRSRDAEAVAARKGFDSFWFRTDDLMRGLGKPVQSGREGNVPRMGYRCADGVLRVVFPDERWIPLAPGEPEPFIAYDSKKGKYCRDPLTLYDVDPVTFEYTNRRVIFDAPTQAPALATPAADLTNMTPVSDGNQWLIFRVKDRDATRQGTPPDSLRTMGAHCVELSYPAGTSCAPDRVC